jgi:hypothetical protein
MRALIACLLGIAVCLGVVALGSPAEAKVRETFFGIHDNAVPDGDVPRVATGALRLWDAGVSWREIERSRGDFDWSRLDAGIAHAEEQGLRPLIVMGQTPRFYARHPKAPGAYGPGATSMPALRAWKRYAARLAQRYGTAVDYQIWNEPNISGYWTGTQAQMAKLTVTASRTITRVLGSRATIVGPSFPLRMGYQQKWFKEFWHQSMGGRNISRYVDAISANLYPLEHGAPEAELPLLRFARHALPSVARHKPLWNTEINFGLRGGPTAKRISRAKQASYVARTLLLNANSHIARMYWYAWNVSKIANTHLNRPSGRLTRAGRAWNLTHDWLLGTKAKGCHQTTRGRLDGLWTCKLRASSDEVRRVYYKPAGDAVRITTVRSTRSWSDLGGHVTTQRGPLHLRVGRLPVMVSSRR